jgi:hypothetical protein
MIRSSISLDSVPERAHLWERDSVKDPEYQLATGTPSERVTVAPSTAGVSPMPIEAEYCRRQAERMRALAKQCSDRDIRDRVEAMAKSWADKAVVREDRRPLHLFMLA